MIQSPIEEEFRSENFPYIYDAVSSYQYPIYHHNPEQSVGPTSKHFLVVGFIGMLLLFAILQNTLMSAKRKDGLLDVSRRKRDLIESRGLIPMVNIKLKKHVLFYLSFLLFFFYSYFYL